MAEQTLDSDQLILWRRTFGAVWIVTVALLAYTFFVGGSIFLSTWWMIAVTSTAFAPLVVFIVALVPFSRRRPLARANHRAIVPVFVLAVAVGVAGFFAVGRVKSMQVGAARQSLGNLGEVFLPANSPVSSLSGPTDSIRLMLEFADSEPYLDRATSKLPIDWIVSDLEGSRDMVSPVIGGRQWMVIGSGKYVTIVRVSAGEFNGILSQDWVHPDGTPLAKSDWNRYGKE